MKHPLFSFWLLTISLIKSGSPTPCSLRDLGSGNKVCVCNATYCDTIAGVTDIPEDRCFVFTSNKEGLRFNKTEALYSDSSLKGALELIVNDTKKFQKLLGFGGCFSDSSLINMELLSNETKDHLMRSYFSTTGIEYNMGRVPIGGSDFSTRFYTYDDVGPDPELKNFKLAPEDFELKIPYINKAKEMSERELLLLSSPWSPPNWMKTINITSGFCFLKEEYYDVYSQYLLRFLDEYKKQGLEFWGMTSGNEPSLGFTLVSQINALGWLPWSASDWIADSLGPLLRNSTHNQTLLLAIDDQRLFLPWWLEMMVSFREDVLQYIDGIAVHWYWDWLVGPDVISDIYEKYPNQFILYTEASMGWGLWGKGVDLGSWYRGERYLDNILENLNHGVSGWIDWNLVLDMTGGPTYIDNNLDSPIIVDAEKDEFYKQPMFYALGHLSKFIEPGAQRVELSPTETGGLHATAVKNPDGKLVLVILSTKSSQTDVSINVPGKGWVNVVVPAKSFTTILC